ncbi:DUF4157 domain-containing protein [Nostoc sp. CHAB 5784]|uniref:eCIS core domain-containing protein n=1 Tax=Nostoc mirabile TaxID=2907820 RepID=UPI001E634367|nr:DUF4157 domain-containing protein [Nostoc mirabile]MCC5667909.1 DUF4157 domain-containing protein [Nostoc mirabile CHAB5784]
MTSKRIAQTNQHQNGEKSQESGILQRAAVRSVSKAEAQSTDDKEAQPLSNSAFSKDFSRVPISTTKPQQIMVKQMVSPLVQQKNTLASVQSGEGEPIQRHKMSGVSNESIGASEKHKENKTGLPNHLKTAAENYSGYSLDDVKVHYNSPKPAQLQAYAYAQGTNIYVAPGRERDLRHEVGHVIQQKQGRVKPTIQAKGMAINDDLGLEKEADAMALKFMQRREIENYNPSTRVKMLEVVQQKMAKTVLPTSKLPQHLATETPIVQRMPWTMGFSEGELESEEYADRFQTYAAIHFLDPYNAKPNQEWQYLGKTKPSTTQTHGEEHAEDVAIRKIIENWNRFSKRGVNRVALTLTKSPCTSVQRNGLPATSSKTQRAGCAEVLIGVETRGITHNKETKSFHLIVICKGMYAPAIPGKSQAQVEQAGREAIDEMKNAGIDVSGDVWPAARQKRQV